VGARERSELVVEKPIARRPMARNEDERRRRVSPARHEDILDDGAKWRHAGACSDEQSSGRVVPRERTERTFDRKVAPERRLTKKLGRIAHRQEELVRPALVRRNRNRERRRFGARRIGVKRHVLARQPPERFAPFDEKHELRHSRR
jgi:hypothetical protein